MDTMTQYSPWDLLPAPEPKTVSPPLGEFYESVAKHLVKDTVRLMNNGLHIDLDKVGELEQVLDQQLETVSERLAANPIIRKYLEQSHKHLVNDYIADQRSKLKQPSDFLKDFKYNDMTHRSYFMYVFATKQKLTMPSEQLPTGIPKWPAKLVKKFTSSYPLLDRFLEGKLPPTHSIAVEAMQLLAKHKADMYNDKYLDKISSPSVPVPAFNPASPKQKTELFDMLNLTSEAKSKDTGLPSWNRDQIERINKETSDPDILDFTQAFIDHSFAAIVRNNFIEAFYKYTVDSRLYGSYKLLGAKTGRFTSSSPNMLNMPSTGSIFAKPIKKCFTAPEGFLIATADYSALEDRVIASLSRDTNKCNIFLENLDGHCLNAYGYFLEELKPLMPITGDTTTDVKLFNKLKEDDPAINAIRQKGKPATFGLAYGSYPPKVAATLKVPINEAESIFNNYHNVLYPGITDYRENYVLPTTLENGKIHLGMGFYLNSDRPDADIRTLNNATCQFWSILTALTINKMHQLIDLAGYQNDIIVTSTIYDSIYFEVRDDVEIIKWLNDNLIPTMTQDFMENQTIKNTADLEIGHSWGDLKIIRNDATLEDIQAVRNLL